MFGWDEEKMTQNKEEGKGREEEKKKERERGRRNRSGESTFGFVGKAPSFPVRLSGVLAGDDA